jgi:hypothetical protein
MDEIKIAHYPFKISEQEHLAFNGGQIDGLIDYDTLRIILQKGMVPPKYLRVLWHEVIHGLTDIYNLVFSEDEVDMLAIAMATFFVDNLDFLKEMIAKMEASKEQFPLRIMPLAPPVAMDPPMLPMERPKPKKPVQRKRPPTKTKRVNRGNLRNKS